MQLQSMDLADCPTQQHTDDVLNLKHHLFNYLHDMLDVFLVFRVIECMMAYLAWTCFIQPEFEKDSVPGPPPPFPPPPHLPPTAYHIHIPSP